MSVNNTSAVGMVDMSAPTDINESKSNLDVIDPEDVVVNSLIYIIAACNDHEVSVDVDAAATVAGSTGA